LLPEFRNEPLTDFSLDSNRSAFRAALARVESRLPIEGKNRIGGKIVGAGGGGFLVLYGEDKTRLRRAMSSLGLREIRFRFDFEGTKMVAES